MVPTRRQHVDHRQRPSQPDGYGSDYCQRQDVSTGPLRGRSLWLQRLEYLSSTSNNGPNYPSGITVHPGDSMYALVFYNPSSSDPGGFEVWDWTTMTYFYVTAAVNGSYYDGESAEFIDERPQIGTNPDGSPIYSLLADYGYVPWTSCEVFEPGNSQAIDFATLSYIEEIMYDSNGKIMSDPYPPSSNNAFTDYFHLSS